MSQYSVGTFRRRSRLVSEEHTIHRFLSSQHFEYGGVQARDVRSVNMNVSRGAAMLEQGGDSRVLEARVSRRTDTQEHLRKQAKVKSVQVACISKKGIRTSSALIALIMLVMALTGAFIFTQVQVSKQQRMLDSLRMSIERSTQRNDRMREEYETAAAEMNIAYNAKDLGLVSSKSLPVTRLYAPQDAQISPADNALVLPSDTLATILGY